jgi:hypothetical protein
MQGGHDRTCHGREAWHGVDDERWIDLAIEAGQLREALVHRADIEQAKGLIMGLRRCTADEAYRELNIVSQRNNIKVAVLATALVRQASPAATGPVGTDPADDRLARLVRDNWLVGLSQAVAPPSGSDAARAW